MKASELPIIPGAPHFFVRGPYSWGRGPTIADAIKATGAVFKPRRQQREVSDYATRLSFVFDTLQPGGCGLDANLDNKVVDYIHTWFAGRDTRHL